MTNALPRLYAILDVELTESRGLRALDVLDAWLDAGVRLIQLRAKGLAGGAFLRVAEATTRRTEACAATLIINDRADFARLAGAAGVHVGQEDLRPIDVRKIVGPTSVVGLSTHTSAQIDAALDQPLDYLAIGPVFSTSTKDAGHLPVGLEMVRHAATAAAGRHLPVVAIGGITLDRAASVLDAGAAAVAVISDLLGPSGAGMRARQFVDALG